jgi:hypothetical protein
VVALALALIAPAAAVASSSVIVYDCAPNLCRIAPDGTGMTHLTSDGQAGTSMAYGGPSLSRDGSKLAFAFNNHIFVSDANANNRGAPIATTGLSALMRPDGGQLAEFEQTLNNPRSSSAPTTWMAAAATARTPPRAPGGHPTTTS